jgi:hypothetical protein
MVALFLDLVQPSSPLRPGKIASSQRQAQPLQPYVMPPVNLLSSISARAMSASVSLSPNVYLACVTLSLLAQL